MSPATAAACAVLEELSGRGVRHVVLSPGSRSQALALAAAELERIGRIRLHVRIDERSAAFTALGIGRESGMPAALVCTSGTAVAHHLPAVLEAHHAGVPLLVLSADRPPELRGVGANQTTDQPGLFGGATRFAADARVPEGAPGEPEAFAELASRALDAALWPIAGPSHLNLPVREPLAGALPEGFGTREPRSAPPAPRGADPVVVERGPRTVVVAGSDAGDAATELAEAGGWPLLAEIVSGARHGANAVSGFRAALREEPLGGRIERALVVGHPTLHREVTALLSRRDVEVIAVRGTGEALDLNGVTRAVPALAVAPGGPDAEWRDAWLAWSLAHEPSAPEGPMDRAALVAAVWGATGPADRIVFGSSRLVRVADDALPPRRVRVHANRGLAGIDGTVATGIGVALANADAGLTRVVLGDLALLHDAGSLLLPEGEDRPAVQVVVGNDGGGTIFDGLEVAQVAGAAAMDRVQYTPQRASLSHLAAAYGWEHRTAESAVELETALASGAHPLLIEVPLER
ncbi:MAG: 2-succinyl-5-enolpyruvyl-6-hydroxy-3-cyclohexene-1-carboxylic-acid synthase [Microbacterium sp.]